MALINDSTDAEGIQESVHIKACSLKFQAPLNLVDTLYNVLLRTELR